MDVLSASIIFLIMGFIEKFDISNVENISANFFILCSIGLFIFNTITGSFSRVQYPPLKLPFP
jgi:hypothetical protein